MGRYKMDEVRLNEDVNVVVFHSIEINYCFSIIISDVTLESIAEDCTGPHSISVVDCRLIADAGLISIT
jgi:hypothetical protein